MPPKPPATSTAPPTSSIPGTPGFDSEATPKTGDPTLDALMGSTPSTAAAGDIFANQAGGGLTVRVQDAGQDGNGLQEMTISDMMRLFYSWSDEKVRSLARQLAKAGIGAGMQGISETSSRDTIWEGFRSLLMEAAKRYAADPNKAPTVEQLLRHYTKNPVGDAGADKKPDTYTQTAESLTDPSNAHALLDGVLAKALGRDPTAAEKAGFLAALNSAERANPQKTKYTLNPETGQYDTSSTSGGMNPEQFAQEWVDDDPTRKKEAGDFQMATTYFDAMLQAIQSPVS